MMLTVSDRMFLAELARVQLRALNRAVDKDTKCDEQIDAALKRAEEREEEERCALYQRANQQTVANLRDQPE